MTSTYPARHGVLSNFRYFHRPVPSAEIRTAAQLFRAIGYRTAAFTSSSPLSAISGIDAGFETFVGPPPGDPDPKERIDIPAGETTAGVLRWLAGAREPFFLWIHYFDPHDPYRPPPPFDTRFAADPEVLRVLESRQVPRQLRARAAKDIDLYDGEILYMDSEIGRVVGKLRERGFYDRSLIVFTADHGEGLGQHAYLHHGLVWDEQVRAPLILKLAAKSGNRGERRSGLVSSIDILPTIVAELALEIPTDQFDGIDVLRKPRASALSQRDGREFYAWPGKLYALTEAEWKYHHYTQERDRLYRLATDPRETRNVIDEHPEVARRMRETLLRLVAEDESRSPLKVKDSIPEKVREQLRSLGYVE